ncbi:MAG: hypothetical protein M0P31_15405 [Solirubrobacteraceae bacterium]|nr:hypothetical protein [Solirubrobacteraceae bacterium]
MLLLRGIDPTSHLADTDEVRQAVIGRAMERAVELRQHELEHLAYENARRIGELLGAKPTTRTADAADPP